MDVGQSRVETGIEALDETIHLNPELIGATDCAVNRGVKCGSVSSGSKDPNTVHSRVSINESERFSPHRQVSVLPLCLTNWSAVTVGAGFMPARPDVAGSFRKRPGGRRAGIKPAPTCRLYVSSYIAVMPAKKKIKR